MSDPKTALVPTSIQEGQALAKIYAASELVPDAFRGKEAEIFLGIAYGMELGFAPLAALRAVTVIKGRTGLYADAMVALVLQSGKADYFRCANSSAESATYVSRRRGEKDEVSKTFTVADAKQAGLTGGGGNYGKYPTHMLEARAKSWLARDLYPDVLHGIYSADELRDGFSDEADAQSAPVDADFTELPQDFGPTPAPKDQTVEEEFAAGIDTLAAARAANLPRPCEALEARMFAAKDVEALHLLAPEAAKFSGQDRDNLRNAYSSRLSELKTAARDVDTPEEIEAYEASQGQGEPV